MITRNIPYIFKCLNKLVNNFLEALTLRKSFIIVIAILGFAQMFNACTSQVTKKAIKFSNEDIDWTQLEKKRITKVINNNNVTINLKMCEAYYFPEKKVSPANYLNN